MTFKVISFDLPYRLIKGKMRQFNPIDEPMVEIIDHPVLGRVCGSFVRLQCASESSIVTPKATQTIAEKK